MIRIIRCTDAQRVAYGGLEVGRLAWTTDTNKLWIGTGSGDAEIAQAGGLTFLLLSDTPSSYVGKKYDILRINTAENSVEFIDPEAAVEFYDDFSDNSRYWAWRDVPGNGSILEPAGTDLRLTLAGAANGDWWAAGTCNSPRAIIGTRRSPHSHIAKLTTHTANASTSCGIFVTDNPLDGGNSGYIFYRRSDGYLGIDALGTANVALTGSAISLPTWLRIRMIGHGNGNTTFFHYSTDGSSWTSLYSVNNLAHRAAGLFAKNWGAFNAITADFDFYKIQNDPGPK